MLPKDEPVSFGRIVRQQAELQTRLPYWYPFAFPANVWFAWREGVPVRKYDVLSPETPRATFSLVFDRTAERTALGVGRAGWRRLGAGMVDWRQPSADGGAAGLPASDVTITIRSRTRFEEPPVVAEIALDVNGVESAGSRRACRMHPLP